MSRRARRAAAADQRRRERRETPAQRELRAYDHLPDTHPTVVNLNGQELMVSMGTARALAGYRRRRVAAGRGERAG